MEEQVLRSQMDLCLFPAFQLATSVTSLSLTIFICKVGITITDHLLWIWLIVSTQLHQTWNCFQVTSPRWQGVRCYSQDSVPHRQLPESVICALGLPCVLPNLSLSIVALTLNTVTLLPFSHFSKRPPDLAAKEAPDLPCTPTLSSTAPAGIPGTWDHGN